MNATFDRKVEHQIEQLQRRAYREMENEIAQRRITWLLRTHPRIGDSLRISPRQAFELLLFEQMCLPQDELPVISETTTEIVWPSFHRCPTLEATQ